MGTLHYMAPEQLLGKEADERSDLFSLGLVLYEMATGRRAFGGEASAAVQDAILNRCPTPAVRLNPEVPARLEDILSKLLEKDRLLRYQSAAEIGTDLKRLRRELELEKSGPAAMQPRSRLSRSRLGAAAALALVLVSGAIFWRLGRAPSMSELKMRQITFNSNESPVEAAQISPDGKYLIFRDGKGLHLMAMATRETRTIPLPEEFRGADIGDSMWFPDSTHLLIGGVLAGQQRPGIWTLSALGGPVTKLRDDALPGYISPNGSSVPFTANLGRVNYREIWTMDPNGANAKKLLQAEDDNTGFDWPGWTPDGRQLTYIKYHETAKQFEVRVESSDLKGGLPATLYSETAYSFAGRRLRSYMLLPDGRMILSLNESGAGRGSVSTLGQRGNLWITRAGDPTAKTIRIEASHRLAILSAQLFQPDRRWQTSGLHQRRRLGLGVRGRLWNGSDNYRSPADDDELRLQPSGGVDAGQQSRADQFRPGRPSWDLQTTDGCGRGRTDRDRIGQCLGALRQPGRLLDPLHGVSGDGGFHSDASDAGPPRGRATAGSDDIGGRGRCAAVRAIPGRPMRNCGTSAGRPPDHLYGF